MPAPRILIACLLASAAQLGADEPWRPLFNGRDLTGWSTFMAAPPPETNVPGLKRDEKGNYLEPIGFNRDPLGVFKVETVDGRPAIHVSGAGFGVITTQETFANFHLRLQTKWGDKKWGYKLHAPLDAGLLYFARGPAGVDHLTWPSCLEFQIQEHDDGDLFTLGKTSVTVPARHDGRLWTYDPTGSPTVFVAKRPIGARCCRLQDSERPKGEWNTLDLICLGDTSIHIVNGKVLMRLRHAQIADGAAPATLDSGQICLQTEGGEVYYRGIEIAPITAVPAEYAEH
ncbi:MAG: DUF1080 domain-containing protein [Opitutaceae bacterium]|jgi:hypothetical protein